MKTVYNSTIDVNMWSCCNYEVQVVTYVVRYKFLGLIWYRIFQNNPKIKEPLYDGEYSSNKRLSCIRNAERQKAKLWLANYKGED